MTPPFSRTFTVTPGGVNLPVSVGGKARALGRLTAGGFKVPRWFVVLPDAFHASAQAVDPSWRRLLSDGERLKPWVASLPILAEARAEIEGLLAENPAPFWGYAVRSSAAAEDGAEHSFAGQLDSFLFVPAAEVPRRIAQVWASAFNDRVRAYLVERKLDVLPIAPGVIVQEMLDAEAAGVAFSADPVKGRRSVAVVSGVWGLGSGLVSGEADADIWEVDRDHRVIARHVARKATAHRRSTQAAEGVEPQAVPETQQNEPCLSDEQVVQVASLARRVADCFGCPQDIEWAWAGGSLHLLQARPITSLGSRPDPDGAWTLWDNSNIAESYNGVTTPLTFSFARMAYAAVYEEFCRIMGVSERQLDANRIVFRRMIGLVRGRVYYNLLSWYRVLALLPGYQVNRRFMEQMMGVKETLPPQAEAALGRRAGFFGRCLDALALGRTVAGLTWNFLTVRGQIRRFERRLARALAPPSVPLARQRLDELAAHYHELERDLLLRWDAPLVNDFLAMIFFGVLRDLGRRWIGDQDGTLANDLLSGEGGVISLEPARRVRTLAELLRQNPALIPTLCAGNLEQIQQALASDPRLQAACADYLEQFGDRCLEELKLETLTLEDHPLPLYRSIGHAARRPVRKEAQDDTRLRRAAEERVQRSLEKRRAKRWMFRWVLRHARERVKSRENLRFERTRVFGRVRRIMVEIGRRLVAEGRLDQARDIFHLTLEEVLGFVDGTAASVDLRGLAALRRMEFERWRREPAPADRFETWGAVQIGNAFAAATPASAAVSGEGLRGMGCCPGLVRGRARVILQPRDAELRPGEILVAPRTDPGWILLFPAAAGLLVEHGSLLSHSAIVAREMALPAIVSLTGLTAWVKDGEWLEMDGSTGLVRKIPAPAPRDA